LQFHLQQSGIAAQAVPLASRCTDEIPGHRQGCIVEVIVMVEISASVYNGINNIKNAIVVLNGRRKNAIG